MPTYVLRRCIYLSTAVEAANEEEAAAKLAAMHDADFDASETVDEEPEKEAL